MKYQIVYCSRTGNTEMLAERIRNRLGEENCTYFGEPKKGVEEELIFAGFWTDKGDCSESLKEYLGSLKQSRIFLFGTAGFGESAAYFERILKKVESYVPDTCQVIGTYMCQGKMPESVKNRYLGMLEKEPDSQKVKQSLENYENALSHPDEEDLQRLEEALEKSKAV